MRLCLIPARGGSKRIPRKNVRPFHGRPMIHYPIAAALASGLYDRVVVSTDDDEIARVAVAGGAEVPFLRPAEFADDHATTAAVILHGLTALGGPAAVATITCLYATAPFVRAADLAGAHALQQETGAPVVFSVTTFAYPILRALTRDDAGRMAMIWPEHRLARSNDLIEAWHDAGQFYVLDAAAFVATPDLFAPGALGYPLPRYRVQDLDTPEDWRRAELMYQVLERDNPGGSAAK